MPLTLESFAAVATLLDCPVAPARLLTPNGRLWIAEGIVRPVSLEDDPEVPVSVVGPSQDEANRHYREQVETIARDRAPMIRAAVDTQREFVTKGEAALFALAQG